LVLTTDHHGESLMLIMSFRRDPQAHSLKTFSKNNGTTKIWLNIEFSILRIKYALQSSASAQIPVSNRVTQNPLALRLSD